MQRRRLRPRMGRSGHERAAGGERNERLRDFRRGRRGAAEGRDAEGREARLQDLRHAQREEGQRHHPADLVFRPPHRRGMDHRRGPGPRPQALFHHRAEHARQRPLVLAQQHARALRQGALPPCDGLRQCAPAASPRHRAVRDRADQARDRLVHGRAPDLPLGLPLPRHGGTHRADLRLRQVLAPQLRVPGRGQGGAHRRRRLEQWLVRGAADQGPARDGAGLCGLGLLADLLPGGGGPGARLLIAGGFSGRVLGGVLHPQGREQPAHHAVDLAERRYRRQRALRRRFQEGARRHQGQGLRDAGAHRPLLPARGQRDRGRPHAERRAPRVRVLLRPLRFKRAEPRGRGLPERGDQGDPGELQAASRGPARIASRGDQPRQRSRRFWPSRNAASCEFGDRRCRPPAKAWRARRSARNHAKSPIQRRSRDQPRHPRALVNGKPAAVAKGIVRRASSPAR